MTMSLRLTRALGCGLVEGSLLAATAVGRSKWAAESARGWIRQFWRTNTLPAHLHGAWNESVIEDEDLKAAILQHLRCIGRYASPKHIIEFFSTPEAEPFTHLLDNTTKPGNSCRALVSTRRDHEYSETPPPNSELL